MNDILLSLHNVEKKFGNQRILKGISIDITKGEFLTLLGSSGCGKTTTLRAIAGLESIDSGSILLNGKEISKLDPDKRNVNTVFQNYALFPHMNVFQNIAYGPSLRGVSKESIKEQVENMLVLVQLQGFEKRMPHKLSGGQRQRVAIARALINQPAILLLDEPLGALDLKLRQHMQTELKHIQRQSGVTFVYVTHDQEEALNMSDRLGIMHEGFFEQIGTPQEIYHAPNTRFVAEFVGNRNVFAVECLAKEGEYLRVRMFNQEFLVKDRGFDTKSDLFVAIHCDKMHFVHPTDPKAMLKGTINDKSYTGSQTKTNVLLGTNHSGNIVCDVIQYNEKNTFHVSEEVGLYWDMEDGVFG